MINTMGFSDPFYKKYGAMETTKDGESVDAIFNLKKEKLKVEIITNKTYEKPLLPLSDHKGVTAKVTWPLKV